MSTDRAYNYILQALRPSQWTKNLVLPAVYFFARWDPSQAEHSQGWTPVFKIALSTIVFCLVSSAVYLVNDVRDIEADRAHPQKRERPLARGAITIPQALSVSMIIGLIGIAGAVFINSDFLRLVIAYLLLQTGYTFVLKRFAFVDVFVIAIGFVLRAIGGALAIRVRLSPWLLLCTFMLALFLALCKRRHEKILLADESINHRLALRGYHGKALDIVLIISAITTIASYALYTFSAETIKRFGTSRLGLTIPFVIFGIFRYLHLVYRHDKGGRPEKILLTDVVLIITILLYGLATLAVFLLSGTSQ